MTDLRKDKFRGVLLGMACGDALGAQIEFMTRDSYRYQKEMTGNGPHHLKPGQWTDDTAMALHLAEHLETDPLVLDAHDLAMRWIGWRDNGDFSCTGRCFDIGTQTNVALSYWKLMGQQPTHNPKARGNGALMRVAPVVLQHWNYTVGRAYAASRQALVTHGHPCADLCVSFAGWVQVALNCADADTALKALREVHPSIYARTRKEVKSTGYDRDTYEAALWAVLGATDMRDAIQRGVNLGDDADTVGAVTGALAGAVWGTDGLPSTWLRALAWGDRILGVADRIYERTA